MRKKTQSEVAQALSAKGYVLNDVYKSAKVKMNVTCPEGHKVTLSWAAFQQGKGCIECAKILIADKRRTPFTQVVKEFKAIGLTLLETEYKNNEISMRCRCENGHETLKTLASVRNGQRCDECMKAERGKTRRRNTANKAIAAFEAEGYTVTGEYVNSHSLIDFICPEGHKHKMSWTNFSQGMRCGICQGKTVDPEAVRQSFESEGYKLLGPYEGNKTKMHFICPEGHESSMNWSNWNTGHRCGYCFGSSMTEFQLKQSVLRKKIRARFASSIRNMERRDIPLKSITSFSGKVAHEVLTTLGDRPEGHQLDHIIPVSYFDLRNRKEVEACWNIANLRWLPEFDNYSRNNRLKKAEVMAFSSTQLELLRQATLRPKKFHNV